MKIEKFVALERKRVCLTAYSAPMAALIAPHVDLILVGDSVGMVLYGLESTQGVTMNMMTRHGKAVRKGAGDGALIVVDMPYGTYEECPERAVKCAKTLMKRSKADAVKLEGGRSRAAQIKAIVAAGIPVMGHIGLQPQSAPDEGGFKIKGRNEEQAEQLIDDMHAIEEAGAFAFVLEGTFEPAARHIARHAKVPSIGIGATGNCDGQVLVLEDVLGLSGDFVPKFVKQYQNVGAMVEKAAADFAAEVKSAKFPGEAQVYK